MFLLACSAYAAVLSQAESEAAPRHLDGSSAKRLMRIQHHKHAHASEEIPGIMRKETGHRHHAIDQFGHVNSLIKMKGSRKAHQEPVTGGGSEEKEELNGKLVLKMDSTGELM